MIYNTYVKNSVYGYVNLNLLCFNMTESLNIMITFSEIFHIKFQQFSHLWPYVKLAEN
jgi:hypothetical protein